MVLRKNNGLLVNVIVRFSRPEMMDGGSEAAPNMIHLRPDCGSDFFCAVVPPPSPSASNQAWESGVRPVLGVARDGTGFVGQPPGRTDAL